MPVHSAPSSVAFTIIYKPLTLLNNSISYAAY